MKPGRLVIYLVVCALSCGALLWMIHLRNQPKAPVIFSLNPAADTQIKFNRPDFTVPKLDPPEMTTLVKNQYTFRKTMYIGREDPFALLPAERVAVPDDRMVISPETTEPVPVKKTFFIRAILMSDHPMAYVEENGRYRKVMIGDSFAGGVIIAMNKSQIVIKRQGQQETIDMGE